MKVILNLKNRGTVLISFKVIYTWMTEWLTSMLSWMASTATRASGSGSASASLTAFAALAFPIFPRHTRATSSQRYFTHIRAMFSHTALLERKEKWLFAWVAHSSDILSFISANTGWYTLCTSDKRLPVWGKNTMLMQVIHKIFWVYFLSQDSTPMKKNVILKIFYTTPST